LFLNFSGFSITHFLTDSGRLDFFTSSNKIVKSSTLSLDSVIITSPNSLFKVLFNLGNGVENAISYPLSFDHFFKTPKSNLVFLINGKLVSSFLDDATTVAIFNVGVTIITIFCSSNPKNTFLVKNILPINFNIKSSYLPFSLTFFSGMLNEADSLCIFL
jgi:hypothetical protein